MATNSRATVWRLIERAVHPGTPETEALASALIACKKIHAEKLLSQEPEGLEPWVSIDRFLACEYATHHSFVFTYARPWDEPPPYAIERFEVPKHVIHEIVWMHPPERKKHKFHGTVVKSRKVDRHWYEQPARRGRRR